MMMPPPVVVSTTFLVRIVAWWSCCCCCSSYGSVVNMASYWVDPDTPLSSHTITALTRNNNDKNNNNNSRPYRLVFSDEFAQEGRTFHDGHDPRWTALNKKDDTNNPLHYYSHDNIWTQDGCLHLRVDYMPRDFAAAAATADERKEEAPDDEEEEIPVETTDVETKYMRSGMLQSWNKFCFIGGIVEFSAKLPGNAKTGGLWPASEYYIITVRYNATRSFVRSFSMMDPSYYYFFFLFSVIFLCFSLVHVYCILIHVLLNSAPSFIFFFSLFHLALSILHCTVLYFIANKQTNTVWMMGNLVRATYLQSSDFIWPFSTNVCNDLTKRTQEINACLGMEELLLRNDDGMQAFRGRGSPEIDILETMYQKPWDFPVMSSSLQVAPGIEGNRPIAGHAPNAVSDTLFSVCAKVVAVD